MDPEKKAEMMWIKKTIAKVTQGILQAETIDLPSAKQTVGRIEEFIGRDKKTLTELKNKLIRLKAEEEEEKDDGNATKSGE